MFNRKPPPPRVRPTWMNDRDWDVLVETDRRAEARAAKQRKAIRGKIIRLVFMTVGSITFLIMIIIATSRFADWINLPANIRGPLGIAGIAYLVARMAAPSKDKD